MASNFINASNEANDNFEKLIKPELINIFKNKIEITSLEVLSNDNEIAKMFDVYCGIDAVYKDFHGIRGIASRIQKGKAWDTFTIRHERESGAKTEYEKRKYAIENNYFYPYLTLQAYVNDGKLLSMALAKTTDIFDMIEKGFSEKQRTGNGQIGQATFYVVRWLDMVEQGYKIIRR